MVNITVGQTLNIGIAVWDFCGSISQYLFIDDIGLGINAAPSVAVKPASCLNISNIGIQFKLAVASGSVACNQCIPDVTYATLGTVYTDTQGIASISHIISDTDLTYYQQAIASGASLKILACIVDPRGQQVITPGKCSWPIIISGAAISEPTHMVELQLSPNPYTSAIEQGILQISDELSKYIPFDPDIQYVRTEFSNGVAKVYLKWIGPPATMNISGTELLHAGYNTEYNTQSLITIDDINNSISNFIKLWIIPGLIVAVGFVLAAGILSAGLTLTTIVGAAIAVSSLFVIGYIVHDLMAQLITSQELINNLTAYVQVTSAKDAGYKALDDAFTTCLQSGKTDCCLTLLQGYQKIDQTYISEFKNRLPNMDLTTATKSYMDCTNNLINQFNAGTVTCDTARANFGPCRDGLYNSSDVEFGTKYDANKNYTKPTNWLEIGLIGFAAVLGTTMMTGKSKETVVLKST